MRAVAACSFLLVLLASSAQATHLHGNWLPHRGAQVSLWEDAEQGSGSDAPCPLCVAMHSALPTAARAGTQTLLQISFLTAACADRLVPRLVCYSLFGRPPPPAPQGASKSL